MEHRHAEFMGQVMMLAQERDTLLAKNKSFEEQHRRMMSTLDREYAESKERSAAERRVLKKENEDILRQLSIAQLEFRKGLQEAEKKAQNEKARADEAVLAQKKAEEQRNGLVMQLARLRCVLIDYPILNNLCM
jgi:hypothetical protein